MLFTLEAVHAREGDSLLLHYGPPEDPSCILIDGGSRGVYSKFLKPRISRIREHLGFDDDEPFPLRMIMVSHVDADHITGILDLMFELEDAKNRRRPPAFTVGTLWHNGFEDIIANPAVGAEVVSRAAAVAAAETGAPQLSLPKMSRESQAVIASTKQGRDLQRIARKLRIPVNQPLGKLVTAPKNGQARFQLDHGLEFLVVGPLQERVEKYREQWKKDLEEILKDEKKTAEAQAFVDDSPFNLASISVLATISGRTMLLTGDARGDFLIDGLVATGQLADKQDSMHVDLLKLPHHGSERNVERSFFEQITADHYVISADGLHGNPDVTTLQMLADARGNAGYTLHLTFEERAFENTSSKTRKSALKAVHEWLTTRKPPNCDIDYRKRDAGALSVTTDLDEPLGF